MRIAQGVALGLPEFEASHSIGGEGRFLTDPASVLFTIIFMALGC